MNAWVHLPLVSALGWALLHFVWEGALIALLLSAALAVCRSARVRYGAACAAMLAMVAVFGLTAAMSIPGLGAAQVAGANVMAGSSAAHGAGLRAPGLLERVERDLPWAVPFWMAGALLIAVCRVTGWIAAERMRRAGVCAAPGWWQARVRQLARRIGVSTPVMLLESSLAEVPVVIGLLRPVILVPAGLLADLPTEQLEAILLHELAHVRRLDYLFNLIQSLVESVLFYHPAVWWVSGVIRAERENCCDDVVVTVEGNARRYAEALVRLEERRALGREPALAATGGQLVNRIRRLLNQPEEPRAAAGLIMAAAVLVGVFCLFAAAQQTARDAQDLAPSYRKWVNEEVVYIIEPRERTAFLGLNSDQERDQFIKQFWERRGEAFKKEHYRRITYAEERFKAASAPGWRTDRGRLYIIYGPPDEIESHPDGRDNWLYRHIQGIGDDVIVEFVNGTQKGTLSAKRPAK